MADAWLLARLRWQISWNRFARRSLPRKIGYVLFWLAAFLAGGFFSALIGFLAGDLLRHYPQFGLESLLPGLLLTGIALLLFLSAFGVALNALFFSTDLELLMSAPVNRRAVFVVKILDGMTTYYAIVLTAALLMIFSGSTEADPIAGIGSSGLLLSMILFAIIAWPTVTGARRA